MVLKWYVYNLFILIITRYSFLNVKFSEIYIINIISEQYSKFI
jgi:hypothetical protein